MSRSPGALGGDGRGLAGVAGCALTTQTNLPLSAIRSYYPTMDRSALLKLLTTAERHVLEGARHIGQQKQIIAMLERDGHDATTARNTLAVFEEAQE